MPPSPPYELVVGSIAAGVAATVLAIVAIVAQYIVLQRQLQVLEAISNVRAQIRQLTQLGRLDRDSLAQLAEADRTITDHVNDGMRRLERELRLHTGSDLLHSGGPADAS